MQKVLEINGIISKPFDFEGLCILDDERAKAESGIIRAGMKVVYYLFEGTAATNYVINSLEDTKKISLAKTVYDWYIEELLAAKELSKNY